MATLNEHFLIGAFADYYQELALAKSKISEGKLAEYLDMEAIESDQQLLGILHRKLKGKLTEQQRTIRANATSSEQLDYLKVLYASCALTDEQLLFDVNWEQSEKWQQDYLMERAFFRSECAGSKIFQNIEEILTDRSRVSNRSDLAAVYLLTITLGFVGKYRDWEYAQSSTKKSANDPDTGSRADPKTSSETKVENSSEQSQSDTDENSKSNKTKAKDSSPDLSVSEPGPLEREKEKLYRAMDKPMGQNYVFAQAYEHVLRIEENPDQQRIAPLQRWYRYALYGLVSYLLLSSIIWFALTAGIGSEIDSLQSEDNCLEHASASGSSSKSGSQPGADACSA